MQRRMLESMIPSVDLTCTTGRRVRASANAPLLMSGRDDTFFILSGHVDIFAVRCDGDEPAGPRFPLYRAAAGEIVFGPQDDAPYKFLAVGVDDTEVVSRLTDGDFNRFDPDHLAALLDRFVGGLSGCFPREAPDGATVVIEAGAETETYRNVPIFGPTRGR